MKQIAIVAAVILFIGFLIGHLVPESTGEQLALLAGGGKVIASTFLMGAGIGFFIGGAVGYATKEDEL